MFSLINTVLFGSVIAFVAVAFAAEPANRIRVRNEVNHLHELTELEKAFAYAAFENTSEFFEMLEGNCGDANNLSFSQTLQGNQQVIAGIPGRLTPSGFHLGTLIPTGSESDPQTSGYYVVWNTESDNPLVGRHWPREKSPDSLFNEFKTRCQSQSLWPQNALNADSQALYYCAAIHPSADDLSLRFLKTSDVFVEVRFELMDGVTQLPVGCRDFSLESSENAVSRFRRSAQMNYRLYARPKTGARKFTVLNGTYYGRTNHFVTPN